MKVYVVQTWWCTESFIRGIFRSENDAQKLVDELIVEGHKELQVLFGPNGLNPSKSNLQYGIAQNKPTITEYTVQ